MQRVRFADDRSGPCDDRLALGVDPEWIDQFVDADFVRDGESLWINASWQDDEEALGNIATMILYVLHWSKLSETRWCRVGASARLFFRSLACGLEALVELCQKNPNISMIHLSSAENAGPKQGDSKMNVAARPGYEDLLLCPRGQNPVM